MVINSCSYFPLIEFSHTEKWYQSGSFRSWGISGLVRWSKMELYDVFSNSSSETHTHILYIYYIYMILSSLIISSRFIMIRFKSICIRKHWESGRTCRMRSTSELFQNVLWLQVGRKRTDIVAKAFSKQPFSSIIPLFVCFYSAWNMPPS